MSDLFGEADSHQEAIWLVDPTQHDGASAVVYLTCLTESSAERYFNELRETLAWEQRDIVIYGKRHLQPRLVAWYGDPGTTYHYSGQTLVPLHWTQALDELRSLCESIAETRFNSVLANLYRDGQDAMGWHADDEPELGPEPVIASLSLGCERRFDLRHKINGDTKQVVLPNGSLLVMSGSTQRDWKHQIARSKKVTEPRINLTFRWVNPPT